MRQLSAGGNEIVGEVAERHGFSPAAVACMLRAVDAGHGRMAQFDHPEFGGAGQWMRGGMTMVSDMFNATLKARVERLCDELSRLIASDHGVFDDSGQGAERERMFTSTAAGGADWWPAHLGRANSAGSQNAARYAYFAEARRLAIDVGGRVTVYDTLDHRINGVAQQQSNTTSLSFSSQHGIVEVASLPVVGEPRAASRADSDIFASIEKLAELHRKGILSDAEFVAKKSDLLSRL
jgi:hypothetical protein